MACNFTKLSILLRRWAENTIFVTVAKAVSVHSVLSAQCVHSSTDRQEKEDKGPPKGGKGFCTCCFLYPAEKDLSPYRPGNVAPSLASYSKSEPPRRSSVIVASPQRLMMVGR